MKYRAMALAAGTALMVAGGLLSSLPAQAATATGPITGLAGKGLDVASGSSTNGAAVQLYDCNGTAAQQWTVGTDGTIRALGKCLDVTGQSTANGATLQLWDCAGSANQQWTVTAAHD